MLPEIALIILIIASAFSLSLIIIPSIGLIKQNEKLIAYAPKFVNLQFFAILIAYLLLTWGFVQHDFSIAYVAQHSSRELPLLYRITAVWGGHEGSILLWTLFLSLWTVAVSRFSKPLPIAIKTKVLIILGMICYTFILFMLITSNPFLRLLPNIPLNGQDLNPLLQDPGFFIHPPLLYLGYVGFSVSYALSIACLISGKLDKEWARWSRPWVMAAWSFLTIGITLGSWWAYRELGWGGWWFWDPVENASLMPWLAGTALCHSLIVVERRNTFKAWTVFLAISAFTLSLIGTFLVRSGILTSVHAFAVDPKRGLFILGILSIVIVSSLLLYAVRVQTLKSENNFALFSRESLLLSNNVILTTMLATILLGTLYPLIADAFHLGKISVGAPYFNQVMLPLTVVLLITMAIAPYISWHFMPVNEFIKRFYPIILLTCLLSIIYLWIIPTASVIFYLLSLLSYFVMITLIIYVIKTIQYKQIINYAMLFSHLGIALLVLGIAISVEFSQERFLRVHLNEKIDFSNLQITFSKVEKIKGDNYEADRMEVVIEKNGQVITTLYPEKRFYYVNKSIMTDAAIQSNLFNNIYVAMGEPLSGQTWSVRIYQKPFVEFIWLGGLLMLLGGLFSFSTFRKARLLS